MKSVVSDDAEIFYEVFGKGPPVVLLHPFPTNHAFWLPAAEHLKSRYRLILPDLRGHGQSGPGEGPVTMRKHADDLARILRAEEVDKAIFAGVSIGGYLLFEFWRRYPDRVASLVLCSTRAQADTLEARNARLQSAEEVLEKGTEAFVDKMIPRLFGNTTLNTRPDLVEIARRFMLKMSPKGISLLQRGMAERPDSMDTLKTINVQTLIMAGDEDVLTPVSEAELMRQNIPGARLRVIQRGGHFTPFEQAEAVGLLVRQFCDQSMGV
jgi:3-oxoadipate enol-lactonase